MDTDSFITYIKTDDIQNNMNNIAEDVETRFDTSNYGLNRLLLKGKNKRVIGLMKEELGENMKKVVELRAKTYSYLIDDGKKVHKKVCHKSKLKF